MVLFFFQTIKQPRRDPMVRWRLLSFVLAFVTLEKLRDNFGGWSSGWQYILTQHFGYTRYSVLLHRRRCLTRKCFRGGQLCYKTNCHKTKHHLVLFIVPENESAPPASSQQRSLSVSPNMFSPHTARGFGAASPPCLPLTDSGQGVAHCQTRLQMSKLGCLHHYKTIHLGTLLLSSYFGLYFFF